MLDLLSEEQPKVVFQSARRRGQGQKIYHENSKDLKVSENFPSDRAKLLCVLNPTTFKKQDRDGLLQQIIDYEYKKALEEFVQPKSGSIQFKFENASQLSTSQSLPKRFVPVKAKTSLYTSKKKAKSHL